MKPVDLADTQPVPQTTLLDGVISPSPPAAPCASCGRALESEYCPACGQAREPRLTIPGVLARLGRRLKRLDFKIVRTFAALLRRPGDMIREYVRGRRAAYTNPLGYAFLSVTAYVAVDSLMASQVSRIFDPVLMVGALAPYIGIALVLPAALLLRWLFRKHDLTHAEAYTFVLYTGSQIVLFETLMLALTDWTSVFWPRYPAAVIEAAFTAWALTRFLDDRRLSVWLRGLLTFLLMGANVVTPIYLLVRSMWSVLH
jgi:hypothetical protein